jgi:hypothetical protein
MPEGTRTVKCRVGVSSSQTASPGEFHSQLLPRYARRTREIDEAILSGDLGGVNSRRIRTAVKPLLGERHLSKSAVSRIVGRLKALFATWQGRGLSAERYPIVFLDGFHLKIRVARRVVSIPVLAASDASATCLRSSPRNGSKSHKSVEWVNRSAGVTPSKQFPQESGRIRLRIPTLW